MAIILTPEDAIPVTDAMLERMHTYGFDGEAWEGEDYNVIDITDAVKYVNWILGT